MQLIIDFLTLILNFFGDLSGSILDVLGDFEGSSTSPDVTPVDPVDPAVPVDPAAPVDPVDPVDTDTTTED